MASEQVGAERRARGDARHQQRRRPAGACRRGARRPVPRPRGRRRTARRPSRAGPGPAAPGRRTPGAPRPGSRCRNDVDAVAVAGAPAATASVTSTTMNETRNVAASRAGRPAPADGEDHQPASAMPTTWSTWKSTRISPDAGQAPAGTRAARRRPPPVGWPSNGAVNELGEQQQQRAGPTPACRRRRAARARAMSSGATEVAGQQHHLAGQPVGDDRRAARNRTRPARSSRRTPGRRGRRCRCGPARARRARPGRCCRPSRW